MAFVPAYHYHNCGCSASRLLLILVSRSPVAAAAMLILKVSFGGAASGLLDTCCRSLSSMLLPSIEKAVSVWTDGRMGKEKGRCYASGT